MSRANAQLGELARLSARLENALAAGAEAGADISPALALLRSLAERAEAGGELEAADLGRAGMPDAQEPQTPEAPEPAPEEPPKRKRRRNWGKLDKWVVFSAFGDRVLRRETGRGGAHGWDITPKEIHALLVRIFHQRMYGAFGLEIPGLHRGDDFKELSGAVTLADMGVTMQTPADIRSCIRSLRDQSKRRKLP